MESKQLKYKILNILLSKGYFERARLRRLMRDALDIGETQFSRKLNTRFGDTLDFNGQELQKIATILGVSVDFLYNTEICESMSV